MDEVVIRSMARWPDVPDVYGWLALDRRGNWLVKGRSGGFERIGNKAVGEFIGRNYQHDDAGCWFFQNGPQRVFVTLQGLPLVYRLEGDSVLAHTGAPAQSVNALWLDDSGGVIVDADLGPGTLDDRDLARVLDCIFDDQQRPADESALLALAAGRGGGALHARVGQSSVPVGVIPSAGLATRFGFNPAPSPPPGQPDC
jgi:hypothetical protein